MTSDAITALFAALGGPAGVARIVRRHPSTASRWLNGHRPIPAAAAKRLHKEAADLATGLIAAGTELMHRIIPEAERRAAAGRIRRREAFQDRLGHLPEQYWGRQPPARLKIPKI